MMNAADKTYVTDMNAAHVAANKVARTYLAISPNMRDATLSAMAQKSIIDHNAETAKMSKETGMKPMPMDEKDSKKAMMMDKKTGGDEKDPTGKSPVGKKNSPPPFIQAMLQKQQGMQKPNGMAPKGGGVPPQALQDAIKRRLAGG